MDTESLKSLGWFLLWGGLFFVMMRYGCGRHLMGGHSGHGGHRDAAPGGVEWAVCIRPPPVICSHVRVGCLTRPIDRQLDISRFGCAFYSWNDPARSTRGADDDRSVWG